MINYLDHASSSTTTTRHVSTTSTRISPQKKYLNHISANECTCWRLLACPRVAGISFWLLQVRLLGVSCSARSYPSTSIRSQALCCKHMLCLSVSVNKTTRFVIPVHGGTWNRIIETEHETEPGWVVGYGDIHQNFNLVIQPFVTASRIIFSNLVSAVLVEYCH